MGTDQETVEKPAEKTIEAKSDSIRQEYTFASDVKLKECKYCRVMIPQKAKICPNCKMILKKHTFLKVIASILVLAVIGAGSYCLSAYWGLLPDSAVPVWIAQNRPETPVVSVTTVETTEAAAGAKAVEPTEVATVAEAADAAVTAETKEVTESKEVAEVRESAGSDGVKEETKTSAQSDNVKGEDATQDKGVVEDKSSVGDNSDSEKEDAEEDKSDSGKEDAEEDTSDLEDETAKEDKSARTDDNKANDIEDSDNEGMAKTINEDNADMNNADAHGFAAVVSKEIGEDEAAFRAECEPRKYKSLLRDEEYLDSAVLVTEVEVACQVDGGLFDENVYYLCREKVNNSNCYYIIRDDRDEDTTLILEGDIITVYGQLFGTCRIPANLIETRPTVPAISMVSFDLLEE